MKLRYLLLLFLSLLFVTIFTFLLNLHPETIVLHERENPQSSCATANKGLESRKGSRFVKHSQLVQDMAAGQGIPGRMQCRGSEAVTRALIPAAACLQSSSKSTVSFVSMLVTRNQSQNCDKAILGSKVLSEPDKPLAIFRVFAESINISMPSSEVVVLSNSDLLLSNGSPFGRIRVEIIAGNYTRANLMLQRLESYVAYLNRVISKSKLSPTETQKHIIFTDSDMIIVGDLGCIFEQHTNFDIALTFRNNKQQPVNSGMIFIRGSEKSMTQGKKFLEQVLKGYREKFMKSAGMLGDQLAFAWTLFHSSLIQDQLLRTHEAFEDEVLGTQILFLPCAIYNWTPSEGAGQFHGMPIDVKVLHFKGSRKRVMLEAWKFYKEKSLPRTDFSDMKCLVLGSGRAKYDF
ncbi:hypothetical protein O6H91_10G040000 [Diphasiastrum complanatum]|uniref:Uncharacterized protein n=2 Tax=Diphasiastrum complanatum TaxID=34168 RepID=A0ACC2CG98_DIPCM|nr:hypothetical protein O6H91_10G040000 [Diphasiastrum complanatum]KAJ7540994.1 hypothetical protein O6H91_10G040000 [Diphasiastrum complanatum]